MAQPQTGGPPGKYGYDSAGNLLPDQTPIQRTLAYILGALQALVAAGGGGGGGGNVTIVGATSTGNTSTVSSNLTTGGPTTITAGALSIEFLLSSDFKGTINGATIDNTSTLVVGVSRFDTPDWRRLAALTYTITAGTAILTVQV